MIYPLVNCCITSWKDPHHYFDWAMWKIANVTNYQSVLAHVIVFLGVPAMSDH